ncbi:response regulator [Burkholderia cenocepacia]
MPYVLVVDDDRTLLAALKVIIQSAGFPVQTAANGVDALVAIRAEAPHAIVSDNMMPLMSGVQLWRSLAIDPKYRLIPFLFQSAVHSLPADVCPTAFLRKPYSPARLLELLRGLPQR